MREIVNKIAAKLKDQTGIVAAVLFGSQAMQVARQDSDSDLANKMANMVGFRNIAVYEYEKINLEILKNIVDHHLSDIEQFYSSVLKHFNIAILNGE